jgi:enoyl-CoA hydratase
VSGGVAADGTGGRRRLVLPGGLLSPADARRLADCLEELAEADDLRLLEIHSRGPDFCLGVDVPADEPLGWLGDVAGRLEALPVPVLAAVAGHCDAEGLALVLGADLVVAHPAAAFATPGLAEGRLPRLGVVSRLTRAVGRSAATAMVLLGEVLDADHARRLGLVHEVHPDPGRRLDALADELAQRAPLALELAKDVIRRGTELPLTHALRLEGDANHLLQASEDRAEGLAAFFDRRPAHFRGR